MQAAQALRNLIGPLELIHEQAGPKLLRLARNGVLGLWLVKLLLDPLWRLAELPPELYRPTGILTFLSPEMVIHLLTPGGLTTFWLLTFASTLLCFTRLPFASTSTMAALFLTAYSSLIRSFGPAVHTDIPLLLAVYIFAGYAWADFLQTFFNRDKKTPGSWSSYPLVTIVALLTLTYMLVGINRILSGGMGVFTSNTMVTWAVDASLRGYYFNTDIGWHVPEWPVTAFLLRGGLPAVTIFEILAPLCLAWPRFRWVFIPFMLSFHLLSLVFMNIFFFDDMLLYLLLIDWSRRWPSLRARNS